MVLLANISLLEKLCTSSGLQLICPPTRWVTNRDLKFMGYVLVTKTQGALFGPLLFIIFVNDFHSLYVSKAIHR